MVHNLPLVGRQHEVTRFQGHLNGIQGGVLLIVGEAGAGKSRLLTAWLASATSMGRPVHLGRCLDDRQGKPLGVWKRALPIHNWHVEGDLADLAQAIVAKLGQGTPAVLAFEDIHWADDASLELLRLVGTCAANSQVLLVVTYRDLTLHRPQVLSSLLRIASEVVTLGPLTEVEIEELARAAGRPQAGPSVYARSGGNPFFAHALLTAPAAGIPGSVQQAIAQQLHGLSAIALEMLRAAAVLGTTFDFDLLSHVLNQPEEQVLTALEECVAQALIREVEGRFSFALPLVREFLYNELLTPRRMQWHRRVAAVATDPDLTAYHLGESGAPQAVPHLMEAAKGALKRGRHEQASRHVERALALTVDQDPELLLLAAAASRFRNDETAHARAHQAYMAALKQNDPIVAALARHMLAWLLSDKGDPQAPVWMDKAHKDLSDQWREPRLADLQAVLTGRRPWAPGALDGIAAIYLWSGRPDAAEAVIREVMVDAGPNPGEMDYWILAEVTLLKGEFAEASQWYRLAVDDALSRVNYILAAYRLAVFLDHLVLYQPTERGEIEQVAARLTEVGHLARKEGGTTDIGCRGPLLGYWYWQEDWDRMRQELEANGTSSYGLWRDYYRRWAIRLSLRQGQYLQAQSLIAPELPPGGPGSLPRYGDYRPRMTYMTWMAEASLLAGDPTSARLWLETVDAWHEGARPSQFNHVENARVWALFHKPTTQRDESRVGPLTVREVQVAKLVAQGLTDKDVGAQLFISPRTVDGHLRNIFTKLDLSSRSGLTAWAARNGLIDP